MTTKYQKQSIIRESKITFLLCLFVVGLGYGQTNLVPNFAFEQRDSCPGLEDQAQFCSGWSKYSTNTSTPDYYNACSSYYFSVPNNQAQFQLDHRGCGAYMGCITWSYNFADYREQIGIQLSQPLTIGQKYYLSFYTVMAGQKAGTDYFDNPSNNIGMRLSTVAYSSSNPAPIDNFAHLRSVSVISDTNNWIRISGSILADSAYQYLMLGSFFDDANTDTTTLTCATCQNWYSYYLIDDVCVSTDSLLCNGGVDALPCVLGVNELNYQNELLVSPNPLSDFCKLSFNQGEINEIFIYDVLGKLILDKNLNDNHVNIDFSEYPQGIYTIKVTTENNRLITRKIIKT